MAFKQRLATMGAGLLGMAALVTSFTLTGCKDDDTTVNPNPTPVAGDTIYVTMRDGIIEMPRQLTARSNAIFKITNKGTKEHQFEIEIHEGPRKGEEKLSKVLTPGQSDVMVWELLPLEYEFYCPHQPGAEHKDNGEKIIFTIDPAPTAAKDTIFVTMRDGIIEMPMNLTARSNAIFKITNKGSKEHQFEIEIHEGPRKGEEKLSKVLSPGQSDVMVWELLPLEYEFYCPHQPGDEHKNNGEKIIYTINPAPAAAKDTIFVTMRDGIIEMPRLLKARTNAIFKITNKGTKEHQFEIEIHEGARKGEEKLSKVMGPGQSDVMVWELLPLEYEFYCPHQPGAEHKDNGEKIIFTINP